MIRRLAAALLALWAAAALAYEPLRPGDPAALLDWRWLARPQAGERRIANDPWGRRKLAPCEGGFLALDVEGPGVLDHLWASANSGTHLTIVADGARLWHGSFGLSWRGKAPEGIFPEPLLVEGGGMQHLLAPVGFATRLRLVVDKPSFSHFASYRLLPKGTPVAVQDAAYAAALARVAEAWKRGGYGLHEAEPAVEQPFVLPARGRTVALSLQGSGELVALEFHLNPALTGTLREVVAELTCDGLKSPSLRMPLPDLAGTPHPWPCGRWDRYSGTLAAGLRYPWYLRTPRIHHPEATVHLNLPIPYADGLRIELVNRSDLTQFVGHTRAVVKPLAPDAARRAGRLCGTRLIAPVRPGPDPLPLITLPGRGQVVGLGLYLTGNAAWPAAVHESFASLALDGASPILGHGLLPLWFQGIYGGPVTDRVLWNHPRLEEGYAGVTRHFITDPIPFGQQAVFGFTPGPKPEGAPTQATVLALWYHFGPEPYAAPALPERAEPLPHNVFGDKPLRLGPGDAPARLAWAAEAEALASLAVARHTDLRIVEDTDHNYHPSGGKYLHIVADKPGGYVDFAVRLPASRYVAMAVYPLWGPGRGTFELDLLTRAQAVEPPRFLQGDAYVLGRILGSVPTKTPVFAGDALDLRRDPGCHHTAPLRNPAPDAAAVLRLTCLAKPLASNSHLLKIDRIRCDAPPPTAPGWREFEELPEPEASGSLEATLPRHGRFEWSAWGALRLESPRGGKVVLRALLPTGPQRPKALLIRGTLATEGGRWQAWLPGILDPIDLPPSKSATALTTWTLPAPALARPCPLALEITCTAPGTQKNREAPAQLVLDCWRME